MAAFETVNELRLLDQTTKYIVRAVHLVRVIDIHFQSILLMNVLSLLVLAFMRIFVDCFLFHHMKLFPLWSVLRQFLLFSTLLQHMLLISSHFDIQLAFLIGELEEEIYVVQPLSFVDPEHPEYVRVSTSTQSIQHGVT